MNCARTIVVGLMLALPATAKAAGDNRYCNSNGTTNFSPPTDGPATLPQTCVYSEMPNISGYKVVTVCPTADPICTALGSKNYTSITAAVTAATCGTIIEIQARYDSGPNVGQQIT